MTIDKKNIDFGASLDGLKNRRAICQFNIYTLDHMTEEEVKAHGFIMKDRASSIDEYKSQLASIDKKIAKITGTPPPTVVGLKTASLLGKAGLT